MTKYDGIKIREARRARVRMIRARVVGGSVALFLAVWSLIAVVLITGHDPALARKPAAATTAADTSTTAADSATTTGTTTSASAVTTTTPTSSGATSSSTGSSADSAGSAVTSSQS
jgi:hypothetical protein